MIECLGKGTEIWSRDGGSKGVATGAQWKCRLDGCRGQRITVKWMDVTSRPVISHPCSEGITVKDGKWVIM